MADKTKIPWCDSTLNLGGGCRKRSPECDSCYAVGQTRRLDGIFSRRGDYRYSGLTNASGTEWTGKLVVWPERLQQLLKWKRPRRVFIDSLTDFADDYIPQEFLRECWRVFEQASWHQILILTKNPGRLRRFLAQIGSENLVLARAHGMSTPPKWPLPNVWIGTTIGCRASLWRFDEMLNTPAAVHFVSGEPLLEHMEFGEMRMRERWACPVCGMTFVANVFRDSDPCLACGWNPPKLPRDLVLPAVMGARTAAHGWVRVRLDWLVAGSESGPKARPMSEEWVHSLRDEAVQYRRAFFYKQRILPDGTREECPELDGRVWCEFPCEFPSERPKPDRAPAQMGLGL